MTPSRVLRRAIAHLVPRLCLGTQCRRGSASQLLLTVSNPPLHGRAVPTARSQAEPGNEGRVSILISRADQYEGGPVIGRRPLPIGADRLAGFLQRRGVIDLGPLTVGFCDCLEE